MVSPSKATLLIGGYIYPMDEKKEKMYGILVNKSHACPEYLPFNLVDCHSPIGKNRKLEELTFENWKKLQRKIAQEGYVIEIESAYRSKSYQETVMREIELEKGVEYASKYVAKPGYSEHQTGLALDFCLKEGDRYLFDQELNGSGVLKVVYDNIASFGFILRYPKGKENITGYDHEPWHLRYVGLDLARKLTEGKKTLEEYYAEKGNV